MIAPERPKFISRGTVLAIIAATVTAVLQGAASAATETRLILIAVGAATLALSTLGTAWAEAQPSPTPLRVLLSLHFTGVLAMLWFGEDRTFLVAMPFVSLTVLYLPLRVAVAVACGLVVLFGAFVPVALSSSELPQSVAGFASAVAFVIVFSLVARRERYARRDVERMAVKLESLATQRERGRIAREIHDSLGHCLTAANVQLEAARESAEGRDDRLARVQQLLQEGLRELRRAVSTLREDPASPPPVTHALGDLVRQCNEDGLPATLTTTGQARPLTGAVGFTLYRAAQEALTNVRRHAQATRVRVDLQYDTHRVYLRVSDDGVGPGCSKPGNGLAGLTERAQLVGGSLSVGPATGGGFCLSLEVPA